MGSVEKKKTQKNINNSNNVRGRELSFGAGISEGQRSILWDCSSAPRLGEGEAPAWFGGAVGMREPLQGTPVPPQSPSSAPWAPSPKPLAVPSPCPQPPDPSRGSHRAVFASSPGFAGRKTNSSQEDKEEDEEDDE